MCGAPAIVDAAAAAVRRTKTYSGNINEWNQIKNTDKTRTSSWSVQEGFGGESLVFIAFYCGDETRRSFLGGVLVARNGPTVGTRIF